MIEEKEKKKVVFLDRYNGLRRLPGVVTKEGLILSMADQTENKVTPAEEAPKTVSPTGIAVLPQWLVIVSTILVAIAGSIVAAAGSGAIVVPGIVSTICGVVVTIGTVLGITSQGIRKKE